MRRCKKQRLKQKIKSFISKFIFEVEAGKISTTILVTKIFDFCELYSGKILFPYQEQFGKRVIRAVLENDGDEITALFARQSGKSETISDIVGGLMIILPQLANLPMFAGDVRFEMFKDGLWVGIFAPTKRQASITYDRIKSRIQSKSACVVLQDPEFNLTFTTSNGQTVALSNGSFATAISASDGSNIEGESFKLIICEECQDISNYKIRKSIHPMGAAYNANIVKIGTATTFKGDFYDAIQRNKKDYESGLIAIKNHFEYNWEVAAKYNSKYAKYIEKEKKHLGEKSDEFRMSYCVTPETKILTADLRYVRADSIKKGDKLIGFDENPPKHYGQRKFKESIVENVGIIKRPCYQLTLEDGTKVTCSKEHKWLVFTAGSRTEWKETKDLVYTDRIYKVSDVWEEQEKDYKLGYLAAAFDGEGCISQVNGKISQLCFAQKDNVMLSQVKEYLSYYGFKYGEQVNKDNNVSKLYILGGKYEVYRFLGIVRPKRLLSKFNVNDLGTVRCCKQEERNFVHPRVISKKFVGMKTVIPIKTSTRTYIAEGLASHNCLEWIIERGMFVDMAQFEVNNFNDLLEAVQYDKTVNHVAGIDIGGKDDDTVITVCEVDWTMPAIMESRTNEETGEEEMYLAYNTYVKAWCRIHDIPDYEEQYPLIIDFLSHFKISRVVCDATKEASISHRLRANLPYEVIPFIFTPKSKSEVYKNLDKEIVSGRAQVCSGELTRQTEEFKKFSEQLENLQKGYNGPYMVVSHPSGRGEHDDFPDSWGLSVWGCSFEGTVNTTETKDRKSLFGKKNNNERDYCSRRNSLTAKRRK